MSKETEQSALKKNRAINRKKIRKQKIKQRLLLTPEHLILASTQLLEKIKAKNLNSDWDTVALYIDCQNEVPTRCVLDFFYEKKITVLLPVMKKNCLMDFYGYHPDHLIENSHGILEPNPKSSKRVLLSQADVMFVPCVAFHSAGHRIGRGQGYYDRALACLTNLTSRPRFIGVAYSFQEVDDCYPEDHDVTMDDTIVIRC